MAITICVEEEDGNSLNEITDFSGYVNLIVDKAQEGDLLCFIDFYGDTVFNRQQCEKLMDELTLVSQKISDAETLKFTQHIIDFSCICTKRPHLYLKFYGD